MKLRSLLITIFILIIGNVYSQQAIYILPDGISGESTNAAHPDWIEAKAYSAGAALPTPTATFPVTDPFQYTICVDKSFNGLMQALYQHKAIPKIVVDFVTSGSIPYTYLKVEYNTVYITELKQGGTTADDKVLVNVGWKAQTISYEYFVQSASGAVSSYSKIIITP